jgi:hypothetical protein
MKKNLFILLFALFFGIFSLFSQNYDFNNYKYRFQKLRGFTTEFNTGSNGDYGNSKTTFLNDLNTLPKERRSDPRTNFNGTGQLEYFQNVNTNKIQQNFTAGLNAGADYFKNSNYSKFQDTSSGFQKGNGNSLGLNFNILNRFYNEKNNFILLGGSGSLQSRQWDGSSSEKNNGNVQKTNNNTSNSLNSQFSLNVGAGKGRLEYITDPIMATFLIVDLIEKADIKGVNSEQIENIAKGITKIRNTRFLDFRFRLIDQIEMLDQVLKDNGITSEKAAKYYTTLNDNWLYATQLQRFSGKRWSFSLNSNLNTNSLNEENRDFRTSLSPYLNNRNVNGNTLGNGFDISYENYKQISLKVQKSWGISLSGFQSNINNLDQFEDSIGTSSWFYNKKEIETNNINNNVKLQGNWQYLFQPNSRTFLTFRANPGISIIDKNNTEKFSYSEVLANTIKVNEFSKALFLSFNLSYFRFISQNLYFTINANSYSEYNIRNGESTIESISSTSSTSSKSKSNILLNSYKFNASINYLIF